MRQLILTLSLICFAMQSFAAETRSPGHSSEIIDWENMTVEKGFVLSNELYYKQLCSKIWSKQIPEFQKKNPQVKDVNKFWPGDKITIQLCEKLNDNDLIIHAPEKTEAVVQEEKNVPPASIAAVPKVEATPAPTPEPTPAQADVKASKDLSKDLTLHEEATDEDFMVFAGLGFLTEKFDQEQYSGTSLRYGVKKDLYSRVGYKLTMDLSQSTVFASNKITLKTAPGKRQYYASFGIGNRIGLVKRPTDKLSDNFTSYSLVGAGMLFSTKKIDFDIELGTTVNANPGINFSVMGVKKITESLSLGAYFDMLSTDPKIERDTNIQRQLITGGAVILF